MKKKINVCIDNEPPVEMEIDSNSILQIGDTFSIGNTSYEILDVVNGKGGTQIQVTPIG